MYNLLSTLFPLTALVATSVNASPTVLAPRAESVECHGHANRESITINNVNFYVACDTLYGGQQANPIALYRGLTFDQCGDRCTRFPDNRCAAAGYTSLGGRSRCFIMAASDVQTPMITVHSAKKVDKSELGRIPEARNYRRVCLDSNNGPQYFRFRPSTLRLLGVQSSVDMYFIVYCNTDLDPYLFDPDSFNAELLLDVAFRCAKRPDCAAGVLNGNVGVLKNQAEEKIPRIEYDSLIRELVQSKAGSSTSASQKQFSMFYRTKANGQSILKNEDPSSLIA